MRSSIRLLFVLQRSSTALGGAERQAALLARVLRSRGHEVELVSGIGPGGTLGHALRAATRVWREKPDLVHVHLLSGHAISAGFAAAARGIPLVVKVGASREAGDIGTSRARPWGGLKLALARRLTSVFIAPNAECAEELRSIGVDAKRIREIPNGVDLDRFRPDPAGRPIRPTALFSGRFEPQKGLDILFRAWPDVGAGAHLGIAGDGSLRPVVEAWAAGRADVSFVGPVSDPAPLYRDSRLFLLPSRAEGISNALLEAMASGCAPVATRIGGNIEVIEDGVSGILVPPEDACAFAAGIRTALLSAETLGRKARARAEEFGIDRTADKIEKLYGELLLIDA